MSALTRIPPSHVASEKSILGAMLQSTKAAEMAIEQLKPDDFYDRANREVFLAMVSIALASRKLDLTTLDAELSRTEKLAIVGGTDYLIDLYRCVPSAENIEAYIKTVIEKSNLRKLQKIAEEITKASISGDKRADQIVSMLETEFQGVVNRDLDGGSGWISGADAAMLALEAAEKREKPIPTGFIELDERLCGGLVRPELTIVGARPGKGKSAFLLAAAMNAARNKKHVCYFSLEMSAVQIGQRELAAASLVNVTKQRYGAERLEDKDWAAMAEGLNRLGADGTREYLHIYQAFGMTIERLTKIVRHAKSMGILDLLVLDYIQLVRTEEKMSSDFERLGLVSKGLKQLALMLDVPILTAAQVKRQNMGQERRGGRAPNLDELRGSGDLEQDADNVLLIHTPDDPDDETLRRIDEKHDGIYERAMYSYALPFTVEIAKQRQGPTGRTWCLFRPDLMRFIEDRKPSV